MKTILSLALVIACVTTGLAQEETSPAEDDAKTARNQAKGLTGLKWLGQFEGVWATDFDGVMRSRIVGKRWLINEISFNGEVFSVQTLGYDAKKKQFVGTWVDATSSHIWRYTGTLERDGALLVLNATGPDLNDPTKMRPYRDKYEFTSKKQIVLASEIKQDDGTWKVFNKGTMTRKAVKKPAKTQRK